MSRSIRHIRALLLSVDDWYLNRSVFCECIDFELKPWRVFLEDWLLIKCLILRVNRTVGLCLFHYVTSVCALAGIPFHGFFKYRIFVLFKLFFKFS